MKKCRLHVLILCALIAGEAGMAAAAPGLAVDAKGQIVKDGKPFRAIGVNYFDAFYRTLASPSSTSYIAGFQVLIAHDIHYARILLGGFYPNDMKQYITSKPSYFQRMDAFVKAAEDNHFGIIADLFWCNNICADMVGEHMDAYDDPNSEAYVFMRQYIADVVGRYKDSPAIWGWECGNEYNLSNDLPNATQWLPSTDTNRGFPPTRDPARDTFPSGRTNKILAEFAKAVRAIDPDRIIVSGNSAPRFCAWHNTHYNSWGADTFAQFSEILLRDNPDPLNVLCVHAYAGTETDFFADRKVTYSGLLAAIKEIGAGVKKPVFLGEFGSPAYLDTQLTTINPDEHAQITEIIAAIEDNKIPLSGLWNFDRVQYDPTWCITATNSRGYMLDMVAAANARIKNQLLLEQNGVKSQWALYY
jgi:hypothetical protein